jgi:hypothetical protein
MYLRWLTHLYHTKPLLFVEPKTIFLFKRELRPVDTTVDLGSIAESEVATEMKSQKQDTLLPNATKIQK